MISPKGSLPASCLKGERLLKVMRLFSHLIERVAEKRCNLISNVLERQNASLHSILTPHISCLH